MSATNIVVTVEGVLRKLTDGQQLIEGVRLVKSLLGDGDSASALVALTSRPAAETEEFLDLIGIPHELVLAAREDRVAQLRKIQQEWGYKVDYVIEPDPSVANQLFGEGLTVLLFMSPAYAQPDWRPDSKFGMRSWEDVRAQVTKDMLEKSHDDRIRDMN